MTIDHESLKFSSQPSSPTYDESKQKSNKSKKKKKSHRNHKRKASSRRHEERAREAADVVRRRDVDFNVTITNVDYIMLQSSSNLESQRYGDKVARRNYLFDAGTSVFQSSLFYFLCSYQQVRSSTQLI